MLVTKNAIATAHFQNLQHRERKTVLIPLLIFPNCNSKSREFKVSVFQNRKKVKSIDIDEFNT